MSTTKTEPQGHALYIPEILGLVCGSLEIYDWLHLMRTCRSIFPMVASHIWKEVDAHILMELIAEKPEGSRNETNQPQSSVSAILASHSFSSIPFLRFL
jgi:hypothetical protein